jgi:hypothetical protein
MFACAALAFVAGLLFPKVERTPEKGLPAPGTEEMMGHMS